MHVMIMCANVDTVRHDHVRQGGQRTSLSCAPMWTPYVMIMCAKVDNVRHDHVRQGGQRTT